MSESNRTTWKPGDVDWKPGDIANGHILTEYAGWVPIPPKHVRNGAWVTAVIVIGGLLSILYLMVGEWV